MADINRDDDLIEIASPPRFGFGERVVARSVVRNDGTYNGLDIGAFRSDIKGYTPWAVKKPRAWEVERVAK